MSFLLRAHSRSQVVSRRRPKSFRFRRRVFLESLESRNLLATLTWEGDVDANWATNLAGNTNWSGNGIPAPGDTLIFAGAAPGTLINDTPAGNAYTLVFNAAGYTIEGNSIAFSNAGVDVTDAFGNSLNTPLTLAADSTFDISAGSTRLGGVLSGAGGGVTKTGAGTLILAETNTYVATTISAGVLQIGDGGAAGSVGTGNVTIAANAGLVINRAGAVTVNNALTLGNNSFVEVAGGTATVNGNVTFAENETIRFRVAAGQSLTVSGGNINGGTGKVIALEGEGTGAFSRQFANGSADGTVVKNGTGTWALTTNYGAGAGWSTGGVIVNDGVLRLDAANAVPNGNGKGNVTVNSPGILDINAGVNINGLLGDGIVRNSSATNRTLNIGNANTSSTFSGTLLETGSGTLSINKVGTGTLILSGDSTFAGTTTISAGTLQLGDGGATGSIGGGAVTISANATLAINRSGAYTFPNALTLNNNSVVSVLGGDITINGSLAFSDNQTIRLHVAAGQNFTVGGANIGGGAGRVIALEGEGTGAFSRQFANGSAAGTLVKNGTGTWALTLNYASGAGWSTGGVIVNDGVLRIDGNNAIPSGSGKGNVTVNSPGILDINSGNVAINGLNGDGTVRNSSATNRTLTLGTGNANGSFSGLITQTGAGNLALVKAGVGTQILTGNNNFTGTTTINGGTLQLGDGGGTGSLGTGAVTIGGGNTLAINRSGAYTLTNALTFNNNSVLSVLGGNITVSGDVAFANNQTARFRVASGQHLTLSGPNIGGGVGRQIALEGDGTGTFERSFASGNAAGTLIKNDAGTWNLTYDYAGGTGWSTGGVVVNGGTLRLDVNNAIPNGNGKGNVTVNSPGILEINAATVNINGLSGDGTVQNASAANHVLVVGNGNGAGTFSGVIGETGPGTLSLTKTGTGLQTFAGHNTYTGATTISAGTLSVSGSLADVTDVSVAAGATYNVAASDVIDGLSGAGNVTLGANQLTVGANNQPAAVFSGVISGVGGSFEKAGTGTQTLSGTNTYTGDTNVSGGTLVLQNGNAIADTAGPVSVALGATLELTSSETIAALVSAGDIGPGTNDAQLVLGANTLTTIGDAQLADVTTAAGGGVIAGGSIIDADDDNNITGPSIYLQAGTGIGTAGDPLETAVSSIQLSNVTSGEIHIANSAGGLLTISDLRGLGFGSRNLGGATTITNAGPLAVAASAVSSASLTLVTIDSAAVGENLTVNAGQVVQSTGGNVTLSSGDNLTVAGNLTSDLGTVTLQIDAGNADPGVGGELSITGTVTTPLVGGWAVFSGHTDNDSFTFSPQTTTEFRVLGDAPAGTPTGDSLILDVSGTNTPVLTAPGTIAPYNGLGSGAWSFASPHRPVLFGSIEENIVTGSYHFTFDNSLALVPHLFVLRDSAAPTANLQLRDGSTGGPIVYQGSLDSILSLHILGSAGDDTVTVDDINTLPEFAGTVPGVSDNPYVTGTPGFLFDGLGGNDSLVFNLTGASASQVFGAGDGSGLPGPEGEIASTAAGVTLVTYFQDVEVVQRTGVGATPGGLEVVGDGTDNAISIGPNGALTRATVAGYTPFDFSGNNYSTITIVGNEGEDVLELVGLGTGQTNNPEITLDGGLGNDILRVHSTSNNTGVVSLIGGAGNDSFLLFDSGDTVDNITALVVVDGSDGNVANNLDSLTIVDTGDLTGDTVVVAAVDPANSADYYVEGVSSALGIDVVFRNIDDLNYTGTSGDDVIDGRFINTVPLHDLNTVALSGWLGADQFLLFTSDQLGGSGLFTPTGDASGVAAISLYGDAPGNPNANDGVDTFGATPAGLTGTGASNVGLEVDPATRLIRPSATTAISIDGGAPTGSPAPQGDTIGDVLNLDISALPDSAPVILATLSPGSLTHSLIEPLSWAEIEDINLIDRNKLTNVQMGDVLARATPDADLIQFTRNSSSTNPNGIRVRVNTTVVDISASNKTVAYAGDGDDYLTQANVTLPAEFYGEDGNDYISGAMFDDWLVGGLGHDQIVGSGGNNIIWGDNAPSLPNDPTPQDSEVGGDDKLSGLGGNDVFYGGGGNDEISAGGGDDYAYGGAGDDLIEGAAGDDRLYGGAGNDVIGGGAGNDLLSGGDGDDRLYGKTGNDVIIGGYGADLLDGAEGNDLLISGSVTNELSSWTSVPSSSKFAADTYSDSTDNDAALLALLVDWSSSGDRSSLASIVHDGDADDLYGYTGDDDFCWEEADVQKYFPATTPSDFNANRMGNDERFGPA
jgi:fibronectin-binding autotransporter adhesin